MVLHRSHLIFFSNVLRALIYAGAISSLLVIVYFLLVVPAFGWDALDYWLTIGRFNANAVAEDAYFMKHSGLLPRLALDFSIISGLSGALWLLVTLLQILLFFIFSKTILKSAYAFILVCILALGQPLVFNHFAIFGYAESILAFLVSSAVYCFYAIINGSKSIVYKLLLFGVVALCVMTKNSGLILISAVLAAGFFSLTRTSRYVFWAAPLGVFTVILSATTGWDVSLEKSKDLVLIEQQGCGLNHDKFSFLEIKSSLYKGELLSKRILRQKALRVVSPGKCLIDLNNAESGADVLEIRGRSQEKGGRVLWARGFLADGHHISFFSEKFSVNFNSELLLLGTPARLKKVSFESIPAGLYSLFHALFVNLSFSLLSLTILLSFVFKPIGNLRNTELRSLKFGNYLLGAFLICILFPYLLIPSFLLHAHTGGDTSGSRFLVSMMPAIAMVLSHRLITFTR